MKTEFQNGNIVTFTAAATVLSGEVVAMGQLVGVAVIDAAIGEEFEAVIEGACVMPVKDAITIVAGEKVYLITEESVITNVATDNVACGFALTGGTSEVKVKLR